MYRPWLLYDNREDPYQLANLIDDAGRKSLVRDLEAEMGAHMDRIGDRFLPREEYYRIYGIEVDHRGKVQGILDNVYDRLG